LTDVHTRPEGSAVGSVIIRRDGSRRLSGELNTLVGRL